ncbi:MAG: hypothetical protein R3330_08865 [Saprospiraceae bacterium]|nr:hypothetical protein [Saprospiraceae bacterium]
MKKLTDPYVTGKPTVKDIRIATRSNNLPGTREGSVAEIVKILAEDEFGRAAMRLALEDWYEYMETTGKYQDEH